MKTELISDISNIKYTIKFDKETKNNNPQIEKNDILNTHKIENKVIEKSNDVQIKNIRIEGDEKNNNPQIEKVEIIENKAKDNDKDINTNDKVAVKFKNHSTKYEIIKQSNLTKNKQEIIPNNIEKEIQFAQKSPINNNIKIDNNEPILSKSENLNKNSINIIHNDNNFNQNQNSNKEQTEGKHLQNGFIENLSNQNTLKDEKNVNKIDFAKMLDNNIQNNITKIDKTIKNHELPKYMTFSRVKISHIPNLVNDIIHNSNSEYVGIVKLSLSPKSLGTIFVEITSTKDKLKLNLKVENPETIKAIENTISQLKEKIEHNGTKIDDFNIEQYNNEQKKDSLAQNDRRAFGNKKNNQSTFDIEKLINESETSENNHNSRIAYFQQGKYIEKYI